MKTKTLCLLTALCGGVLVTTSPAQTASAGATGSATGSALTSGEATTVDGATTNPAGASAAGAPVTAPEPGTVVPGSVMPSGGTTAVPTLPRAVINANDGLGSSSVEASSSLPNLGDPGLPSSRVRPGTAGTRPIGPQPLRGPRPIRRVGQQPAAGVGQQPEMGVGQQPETGVGQQPPGASPDMTGIGAVPSVTVPLAPPDAPIGIEDVPPWTAPTLNHAWVPRHYTWNGQAWQLNAGRWVVAPARGAVWVNGSYDAATATWTPGYWDIDPQSPQARGRPQTPDDAPSARR